MAPTPSHTSVVISPSGAGDIDVAALAEKAGLDSWELASHELDLGELLRHANEHEGHALVLGTGDLAFDASAAAVLRAPLVVVADEDSPRAKLATTRAEDVGATLAGVLPAGEAAGEAGAKLVAEAAAAQPPEVISPEVFERFLLDKAKDTPARIVLPEGDDDRILEAAHRLLDQDIVDLIILGEKDDIDARAKELGLDLSRAEIVDPKTDERADGFVETLLELRRAKGLERAEAEKLVRDETYFGVLLVHAGEADGMVSGAAHTTGDTIRPALQIIRTAPGASIVSSLFFMVLGGRLWGFGDCAVNPKPTAQQLGEMAVVSAGTAKRFGLDPKVALLSYSTGASGAGEDVDKVSAALGVAHELDKSVPVDGPLQFDAAMDPGVAKKKRPDSEVAGQANVFIFPDLNAGNIAYKAVQRSAGALAVGPVLQGLNKPVNDLSRGATVPDIVNTVAITAIQAGGN